MIDERWKKVLDSVHAEFRKRGVDPTTVLAEDRETMTLKAQLSEDPPLWLKEVLGPPGVVFGKPDKIAAAFYERFERMRER